MAAHPANGWVAFLLTVSIFPLHSPLLSCSSESLGFILNKLTSGTSEYMIPGLITKKVGMSRIFTEGGEDMAVTYLKVEPNHIVRIKSKEKDGYNAVVLGIGATPHTTKNGKKLTRFRRQKEWMVESLEGLEPGKELSVDVLTPNTNVTVTGVSKGRGFQGVIKRHHFGGGPETHGSHFKREPGSVGMRTKPGKIHKGKRMPGHMGVDTITLHHRPIVVCDTERGVLGVKGPIPGPNGGYVFITVELNK